MDANQNKKISIVLNGKRTEVPEGLTVLGLLKHLGTDPARVAVELNRAIIRQAEWPDTGVPAEAEVEIVQFVGGGR